jgi:hypothetical protein
MSSRIIGLGAVIAASLATVACGPDYSRTEINAQVTEVPGNEINLNHVTVAEGTFLKAHLVSYNTDNSSMNNSIYCDDTSVIDVEYVISDHDWSFAGLKQGNSRCTISANEHTVLIIDAHVVPQPAAPK